MQPPSVVPTLRCPTRLLEIAEIHVNFVFDSYYLLTCQDVPNSVHLDSVKKVIWHPKAREVISAFPETVRQELGYLLFRVQNGETFGMPYSSPMKTVAIGASELRVRGADGIYRAFYFTKK